MEALQGQDVQEDNLTVVHLRMKTVENGLTI
jgi:hypothetical protein